MINLIKTIKAHGLLNSEMVVQPKGERMKSKGMVLIYE